MVRRYGDRCLKNDLFYQSNSLKYLNIDIFFCFLIYGVILKELYLETISIKVWQA